MLSIDLCTHVRSVVFAQNLWQTRVELHGVLSQRVGDIAGTSPALLEPSFPFCACAAAVLACGPRARHNGPMPRTGRAAVGGDCYRVVNRGNERAGVYNSRGEYHAFVRLLGQACASVPMRVVGDCLMPNLFHLVLWH